MKRARRAPPVYGIRHSELNIRRNVARELLKRSIAGLTAGFSLNDEGVVRMWRDVFFVGSVKSQYPILITPAMPRLRYKNSARVERADILALISSSMDVEALTILCRADIFQNL